MPSPTSANSYDEAEIVTYFDGLGMGFPEAGMAGKEGIAILGEQMRDLDSDHALLVLVV